MTVLALRSIAQRVQVLAAEADQLEGEITRLVRAVAPWLLELQGMGPTSAAPVLVSWSHAGRCGQSRPLPPWPGPTRSRPHPGGSPAIASTGAATASSTAPCTPWPWSGFGMTRPPAPMRRAEGKSPREIRRGVKRAIARQLFKLLQQLDRFDTEVVRVCC
jgi:transposase